MLSDLPALRRGVSYETISILAFTHRLFRLSISQDAWIKSWRLQRQNHLLPLQLLLADVSSDESRMRNARGRRTRQYLCMAEYPLAASKLIWKYTQMCCLQGAEKQVHTFRARRLPTLSYECFAVRVFWVCRLTSIWWRGERLMRGCSSDMRVRDGQTRASGSSSANGRSGLATARDLYSTPAGGHLTNACQCPHLLISD